MEKDNETLCGILTICFFRGYLANMIKLVYSWRADSYSACTEFQKN